MAEARTAYQTGKMNPRFQQFAKDYEFLVKPCIAGRLQTKAKVEAPMKVLDEIRTYNGTLTYRELLELVERINNRVNTRNHKGTGKIPILYYEKEFHCVPPISSSYVTSQSLIIDSVACHSPRKDVHRIPCRISCAAIKIIFYFILSIFSSNFKYALSKSSQINIHTFHPTFCTMIL